MVGIHPEHCYGSWASEPAASPRSIDLLYSEPKDRAFHNQVVTKSRPYTPSVVDDWDVKESLTFHLFSGHLSNPK